MTKRYSYNNVVCLTWAAMWLFAPVFPAVAQTLVEDATHVTVRHESGRYFGWPANAGIWSWGNEILVQYRAGEFQDKPIGSHDIDYARPVIHEQSRSLDGGVTWTHHATPVLVTEPTWGTQTIPDQVPVLTAPINLSDKNTILRFEWAGHL